MTFWFDLINKLYVCDKFCCALLDQIKMSNIMYRCGIKFNSISVMRIPLAFPIWAGVWQKNRQSTKGKIVGNSRTVCTVKIEYRQPITLKGPFRGPNYYLSVNFEPWIFHRLHTLCKFVNTFYFQRFRKWHVIF